MTEPQDAPAPAADPTDGPPPGAAPTGAGDPGPGPAAGREGYRVLARKYRPQTFSELIGQDALVRTLTNAIRAQRLAHAFVLTGVRGVGKTTTARIIAKALNCTGPDGTGGMTPEPCGVCESCRSIAADRHVDVLEMDAASRTGVDDIREIIDGVRYGPVSARCKVYIIDEVHMLSRNAFNALLKTLEEPPPHVKFVFATTEIRKVPVTVLSRCQRFDLPRVPQDLLVAHFEAIAGQENARAEPEAIAMIARAADGSVRDGLSLLDQAVSQGFADGSGEVTADQVRLMLGLADRTRVLDLLDRTVRGDAPGALDTLGEMHRLGADPLMVLQDLLDLTHFLTRAKLVPAILDDPAVPEDERTRGAALAGATTVPVLTRCWQMLLKGVAEVQAAPMPDRALEMVIIRLLHAAHLPTPGDVVRKLEAGAYGDLAPAAPSPVPGGAPPDAPSGRMPADGGPGASDGGRAAPGSAASRGPARADSALRAGGPALAVVARAPDAAEAVAEAAVEPATPRPEARVEPVGEPAPVSADKGADQGADQGADAPIPAAAAAPQDFRALVRRFERHGDARVYAALHNNVHLVRYEPGRLEYRPDEHAPANLAQQIGAQLREWTGQRWMISVSDAPGDPPLSVQDRRSVVEHPVVKAVLERFPGATWRVRAAEDEEEAGDGPARRGPDPGVPDPGVPDHGVPDDGFGGGVHDGPDGEADPTDEALPFDPDDDY